MANPISVPMNFSTTLNVGGGINNSQTSGIILTSVTGLPTDGGVLAFDWANPLDTATIEYIEYTGISGNELTGVIRGQEGYSAKAHSNACTVVGVLSQAHIKRLRDKLTGNDTTLVQDTSNNEVIKVGFVASAVNEITVTNAATTDNPTIAPTGGDTNIGINIRPKGTGVVAIDGAENYAADAGANDTYAVTIEGISAYATGQEFKFKANTANTGAATLNVNSLGAKTIKKNHDQTLADNDIESGQVVTVIYDGTDMQMQSQLGNASSGGSTIQTSQVSTIGSTSTTSTTATDSGLTVTFTPTASSNALILVDFNWYNSAANQNFASILLDGSIIGFTDGLQTDFSAGSKAVSVHFHLLTTGLSNASHTIKVQYRTSSGTLTTNSGRLTVIPWV